jgi:ABC-type Fe3+-hydroxamate transport system substrate-binding protein
MWPGNAEGNKLSVTPANERELVDAMGRRHAVAASAARIVCLVPSITELLFDLGLGGQVVGRTGFCIAPREQVKKVAKVGGTKTIDLARIRRLAPTHVIVNIDENPRPMVEEIARFVPNVVVTHPLAPRDNLALYRLVGGIFGRDEAALALCQRFQEAYDEVVAAARSWRRQSVLYLIWKSPWMTVSQDTYISRTLSTVGWDTYAPHSSARYPTVDLTPQVLADVDFVLLSTEPYSFRERHRAEVKALLPPGSRTGVVLIDGAMTSWYGSRAVEGLGYLRALREELAPSP